MKIKKIENMLDIEEQFDVELQGCLNDCTEYFCKTSGNYLLLKKAGFRVDGNISNADRRKALELFGFYCYKEMTPKTSIFF